MDIGHQNEGLRRDQLFINSILLYSIDWKGIEQIDRGECRVVSLGNKGDYGPSRHSAYKLPETALRPLISRLVFNQPICGETGRKCVVKTSR